MDEEILQDELIEIDTLVKMIKMAFSFENWTKVLDLSNQLIIKAKSTYEQDSRPKMERHIAYYFGYSYLMKGLAYQKLKEYLLSSECITYYSDLNWLNDSSVESLTIIEDFKRFAKGNFLTLEILSGNNNKLDEYIQFLLDNPNEIISGLITILESAIVYSYNVDDKLSNLLNYVQRFSHDEEQVMGVKYLSVYYMHALYSYKLKKFTDALDSTIHTLIKSDKLDNDKYFKKSIALFEILKAYATVSHLKEYSSILNRIAKGEIEDEKDNYFSNSSVGDHW